MIAENDNRPSRRGQLLAVKRAVEAMGDGGEIPAGIVFLSLDGEWVPSMQRRDIGKEHFVAQTAAGIRLLHSENGILARDITDDVSHGLLNDVRIKRAKAKRAETQSRSHYNIEPGAWQERHDPSEKIMVVHSIGVKIVEDGNRGHAVTEVRRLEQGRRRTVDARLWASLDLDQQEAMLSIEGGHRALIGGMGMKPANWERVSGGLGDMSHSQGLAAANYNAWVKEVDNTLRFETFQDGKPNYEQPIRLGNGKAKDRWTMERLSPEGATAIICAGESIDKVARDRRKETRWVRANLIQALNVWLWQTKKLRRPELPDEPVEGGLTMRQVRIRALNRRVENIAQVIEERQRVIRRVA